MPLSGAGSSMGFGSLLPQIRAILEQQAATNPLLAQTLGRLTVGAPDFAGVNPQLLPMDPSVMMSPEGYAAFGNPLGRTGGVDPSALRGGSVVDALLATSGPGAGGGGAGVVDTGTAPGAGGGAGVSTPTGIGGTTTNVMGQPPETGGRGPTPVQIGLTEQERERLGVGRGGRTSPSQE